MASINELKAERLQKAEQLAKLGYKNHSINSKQTHTNKVFLDLFTDLEESGDKVWLTGRIVAKRGHGKLLFLDIFDGTEQVQVYVKADEIDDQKFEALVNLTDRGDFIDVYGVATTTKRGEPSIYMHDWQMITKSLAPLPDSWEGLRDDDLRYRNRHLDLLQDAELRDVFYNKALFLQTARNFLIERGYLEVNTPTLEVTTGGAEARPFKTYHNDFDMDVYLRISIGELWQKRLMAAGFPKTFEMGRAYRNEGSSPEHLQEFINCEFYAANLDFEEGKKLVVDLYQELAMSVFGTTKFETRGHEFDLSDDWVDYDYVETVLEMTGVNVLEADLDQLRSKLEELGVKYTGDNRERLMDSLWKYCRRQIAGPGFLVNHPKLLAPLSNAHPDDNRLTLTCQPILAGSEVGRGHSELNDPIVQRERFEIQQRLLDSGDEEAMMPDWEYVEMMEHGMPPTFGFGFGERLFSFMVDKPIRETTLFPLVRPKD